MLIKREPLAENFQLSSAKNAACSMNHTARNINARSRQRWEVSDMEYRGNGFTIYAGEKTKPNTNADRIRAMSDTRTGRVLVSLR